MPAPSPFIYDVAFSRNLGWLTEAEQLALRGKRVAIAGMGGVGGVHLLTLTRLGIGAFHIADFDRFDLANFNRQAGATMGSVGLPKVEVMAKLALGINPELRIAEFPTGVSPDNVDAFLDGVDLFVDGFDFFAIDIRRLVFARCAERGIPAMTAGPIGMGTGYLVFLPGGMTFEQYFRLEGQPEAEQYLRFLVGLVPRGLHRPYLVDPARTDLAGKRGPSTAAGCELCAGVVAATAVKLLLRRGDPRPAPYHYHFDAYRGRLAISRLPFGVAGPWQRVKLAIARRVYADMARHSKAQPPPAAAARSPVEEILNLARGAPSSDNIQPWRFDIMDAERVIVRLPGHDRSAFYEYRAGEPTFIAGGALLETLRVAATLWKRRTAWTYLGEDGGHRIEVQFTPQADLPADPLGSYLTLRSVDRFPYRLRPLTEAEKAALGSALGERLAVTWHETPAERWKFVRLGGVATDIRLRAAAAFPVHQRIIDWEHKLSSTGIPAGAVGLDRLTLRVMRWALRRWKRTRLLNHIGATTLAALEMDYLPGLLSAAFFTIRPAAPPAGDSGRIPWLLQAGGDIQRFWLAATRLGLAMQPSLAALALSQRNDIPVTFAQDPALRRKAEKLALSFRAALGTDAEQLLFVGRIGEPRSDHTACRSARLSLADLISR